MNRPRLISVDELRAAGALDCPPGWRKSLSAGTEPKRERGLFDEDEAPVAEARALGGELAEDGASDDKP
jgi:hypothetical protein